MIILWRHRPVVFWHNCSGWCKKEVSNSPYFCLHTDVWEGFSSSLRLLLVQQVLGAIQHADHLLQLGLMLLTLNHLDSLQGVTMHQSGPGFVRRTLSASTTGGKCHINYAQSGSHSVWWRSEEWRRILLKLVPLPWSGFITVLSFTNT